MRRALVLLSRRSRTNRSCHWEPGTKILDVSLNISVSILFACLSSGHDTIEFNKDDDDTLDFATAPSKLRLRF
ncbi:hypothetical protein BDP27DRAFT_640345 [Rhodocollybia butyracea]|uniref:Uncharacterized protein n=1 Tax=Rhodocollybia butyracea TaxID=206335 RepID=A0A9P5P3E8_9AGAR|nr:hypothetical protein BDP27DRAFT_640345 [Rhodocollybia butyracea]